MWYSSGTVSVENGSPTVVGDGTSFLSNVRVGDGMAIEGSLALHEIINVTSETGITISPAYEGVSGTGMRFTVVPVLGYDKDLSDAFNRIRLEMGAKVQGLQPWAYAASAAEARDDLELGSAATADVVQEIGNSQADVMSQKATSDALGTKVDNDDSRLSDAREWTASTVSQAEAEAGTSTTARKWTAQRVRQAINAWWNTIGTAFGKMLLGSTNAAAARGSLELGTAATRDVGTGSGNVMKVGAGGWLGAAGSDSGESGYPQSQKSNISRIYRRNEVDNGVASSAVSFHMGAGGSWGRLRISELGTGWIQGGFAPAGTGWTAELIHTGNIRTTTGQSTEYPMTQKAVTDAINGVSDRRDKIDVTPISVGLELIEKLEPVCFKLNKRDWYRTQAATSVEVSTDEDGNQTEHEKIDSEILSKPLSEYDTNDGSLARDDRYTGLIAQDVKAALEDLGLDDLAIIKNYSDEYERGDDRHYIEYMGLIPIMINAIKELSDRVKVLEGDHDS